jgi:hypothetical protein
MEKIIMGRDVLKLSEKHSVLSVGNMDTSKVHNTDADGKVQDKC